jgi:hypothetical protein
MPYSCSRHPAGSGRRAHRQHACSLVIRLQHLYITTAAACASHLHHPSQQSDTTVTLNPRGEQTSKPREQSPSNDATEAQSLLSLLNFDQTCDNPSTKVPQYCHCHCYCLRNVAQLDDGTHCISHCMVLAAHSLVGHDYHDCPISAVPQGG